MELDTGKGRGTTPGAEPWEGGGEDKLDPPHKTYRTSLLSSFSRRTLTRITVTCHIHAPHSSGFQFQQLRFPVLRILRASSSFGPPRHSSDKPVRFGLHHLQSFDSHVPSIFQVYPSCPSAVDTQHNFFRFQFPAHNHLKSDA